MAGVNQPMDTTAPSNHSGVDKPHAVPEEKMPGHWLLAKMGKRVLRPGGLELTQRLLSELAVTSKDDVVEFAPGLGITARMTIARRPKSYIAVERDAAAAATVAAYLVGPDQRCIAGTAEATGLPSAAASVVYGEAMLSMQAATAKAKIIAEAARLLRPGGRYGIHELCLIPDDVGQTIRDAIQHDMSDDIHVGVRPLTAREWCELLEASGLTVTAKHFAPMHLLEPMRLVRDEGLLRAMRFVWNVARDATARQRVLRMRRTFRKYRQHLMAIVLVGTKS
jgi:SAM-dependent methyltransferase